MEQNLTTLYAKVLRDYLAWLIKESYVSSSRGYCDVSGFQIPKRKKNWGHSPFVQRTLSVWAIEFVIYIYIYMCVCARARACMRVLFLEGLLLVITSNLSLIFSSCNCKAPDYHHHHNNHWVVIQTDHHQVVAKFLPWNFNSPLYTIWNIESRRILKGKQKSIWIYMYQQVKTKKCI